MATAVTERRKQWAVNQDRKLRRRHRQAHTSPIEPATPEELTEHRRATAQPSVMPTAQERRNQHVERWIYPWAYAVCLRIASIRDARRFADKVDMLTAHAECTPYYEDELARLAEEVPEEPEPAESQFRQCVDRMYVHDRQTYLKRIRNLGVDCAEASEDLENGELFDLWNWCKERAKESDERLRGAEVSEQIERIIELRNQITDEQWTPEPSTD